MRYRIGHPAYRGANSLEVASSFETTLAILIERNVPREQAVAALAKEYATVYVTGSFSVIEVQQIL